MIQADQSTDTRFLKKPKFHDNGILKNQMEFKLKADGTYQPDRRAKINRILFNQTIKAGASVVVYSKGAIAGCRMEGGTLTVFGGGEVHRLIMTGGKLVVMKDGLVEFVELGDGTSLEVHPGGRVLKYRTRGKVKLNIHDEAIATKMSNRQSVELAF